MVDLLNELVSFSASSSSVSLGTVVVSTGMRKREKQDVFGNINVFGFLFLCLDMKRMFGSVQICSPRKRRRCVESKSSG